VSQLADRYIRDPNEAVKVGQKVKVTVQNVDLARGRIALSMKSDGGTGTGKPQGGDRAQRGANSGANSGAPAGQRAPAPTKPAVKSFVPTKGAVAPNGIRFK
jgi:uncharacterized protein